jgi:hypothetical protein
MAEASIFDDKVKFVRQIDCESSFLQIFVVAYHPINSTYLSIRLFMKHLTFYLGDYPKIIIYRNIFC